VRAHNETVTLTRQTRKGNIVKALRIIAIVSLLLIVGCASPEPEPLPTYTPYPTLEPLPTHTPYPTPSPSPTNTPLPSPVLFEAEPPAFQYMLEEGDLPGEEVTLEEEDPDVRVRSWGRPDWGLGIVDAAYRKFTGSITIEQLLGVYDSVESAATAWRRVSRSMHTPFSDIQEEFQLDIEQESAGVQTAQDIEIPSLDDKDKEYVITIETTCFALRTGNIIAVVWISPRVSESQATLFAEDVLMKIESPNPEFRRLEPSSGESGGN